MKKELLFVKYFSILVKYRKLIVINFFTICVITAIYSLLVTSRYTSVATIIPAKERPTLSIPTGLSSLISTNIFGGSGFSGEELMSLLRSRSIREEVVRDMSLQEVYGTDTFLEAVDELEKKTTLIGEEAGGIASRYIFAIKILVEDTDSQRAADIANRYVFHLQNKVVQLNTLKAKEDRLFIESQEKKAKKALIQATEKLKWFQETHNAIHLETQIQKTIEALAELEAQYIAENMKLNILKKYHDPSHPLVKEAEIKLRELGNQIQRFKTSEERLSPEIFIGLEQAPEMAMELAELMREFTTQEMLVGFLVQQLEQAKIQERRDTPIIQVVDDAIPPELRSFPRRKLMVVAAGALSLVLSAIIIFILEFLGMLKSKYPDNYNELRTLTAQVKKDFSLRRKRSQ
jgi:uncharacterized protein involved in exopolysaccharide biosynthesis